MTKLEQRAADFLWRVIAGNSSALKGYMAATTFGRLVADAEKLRMDILRPPAAVISAVVKPDEGAFAILLLHRRSGGELLTDWHVEIYVNPVEAKEWAAGSSRKRRQTWDRSLVIPVPFAALAAAEPKAEPKGGACEQA